MGIIKKIFNVFMEDISTLGGSIFYFFLIVLAFILNQIKFSLYLVLTYIFLMILISLIRIIYFKQRPKKQEYSKNILDKIDASSFPSAHAARVGALLLSAIMFFSLKLEVLIFFVVIGLLVILSRYYMKKHFAIDLIVGLIVGALCSYVAMLLISLL